MANFFILTFIRMSLKKGKLHLAKEEIELNTKFE